MPGNLVPKPRDWARYRQVTSASDEVVFAQALREYVGPIIMIAIACTSATLAVVKSLSSECPTDPPVHSAAHFVVPALVVLLMSLFVWFGVDFSRYELRLRPMAREMVLVRHRLAAKSKQWPVAAPDVREVELAWSQFHRRSERNTWHLNIVFKDSTTWTLDACEDRAALLAFGHAIADALAIPLTESAGDTPRQTTK